MERAFPQLGFAAGQLVPAAQVTIEGPPLQVVINTGTTAAAGALAIGMTGTIGAGGTLTSAVFPTFGCENFALGVTLSQAGTLSLTRYIDAAGTVANGAAVTQALTAATAGVVNINDGRAAQSARLSIINSGGVAATVSGFAGLMQAK